MNNIDYAAARRMYDPTDQHGILRAFPDHIITGTAAADAAQLPTIDLSHLRGVAIAGMGGSAIGGDILRGLAAEGVPYPILVHRGYSLPACVGANWLVVVMSYSGGTEESLSAYDAAVQRGCTILCITSGDGFAGRVTRDGHAVIRIPGGLAPRFALGHLFFALLRCVERLGIVPDMTRERDETIAVARAAVARFADPAAPGNTALWYAEMLHGSLPVLYAGHTMLEPVLLRWRGQIEENAKMLAYGNMLPEMNHNEIVGWEKNPDLLQRISVLVLRTPDEHPRVALRFEATLGLLRPLAGRIEQIAATASTPLGRVFELVCLGDWISYYLAIGGGIDPFPIEKISSLKNALASA
ncbi:MAG: bifunctional phosphoglucose/phosphomannose isomerase [Ignavibacteriae bacterium]|nr:bifunctional phosphoglucose/phosphomannose isomerase [Ignavibacteriota bacterium]